MTAARCLRIGSPKPSSKLWDVSERQATKLRGSRGHRRHGNITYRDDLVRVVVDVPDTTDNRSWVRDFKERWKKRLEQLKLWMVSYQIDRALACISSH